MRLNENQYIKTAFVVLENLSLLLHIVIFSNYKVWLQQLKCSVITSTVKRLFFSNALLLQLLKTVFQNNPNCYGYGKKKYIKEGISNSASYLKCQKGL